MNKSGAILLKYIIKLENKVKKLEIKCKAALYVLKAIDLCESKGWSKREIKETKKVIKLLEKVMEEMDSQ